MEDSNSLLAEVQQELKDELKEMGQQLHETKNKLNGSERGLEETKRELHETKDRISGAERGLEET